MTLAQSQLTLAEFLALPEIEPAGEYIDGDILQKPMLYYPGIDLRANFRMVEDESRLSTEVIARGCVEIASIPPLPKPPQPANSTLGKQ